MIEVYTTATFDKLFLKLPKKIQIKSDEKTNLFKENRFNPILRTEKLHPKGHEVWSFRVATVIGLYLSSREEVLLNFVT